MLFCLSESKPVCVVLYPHGFLDVVLSDDLSRAVHVPLQTSNQLPAETMAVNITRNGAGVYSNCHVYRDESSRCCRTCMPKLRQSGFGCRRPWQVWSGRNGCPWVSWWWTPEHTHVYKHVMSISSATSHIKLFNLCVLLNFLPVTGKPVARIYLCCHLKDRRVYPGHLARTVREKQKTTLRTAFTLKASLSTRIETKGSPLHPKHTRQ